MATHGKSGTRLYRTWTDMRNRCNNHKNLHYSRYGGRGIKVCDEWQRSFDSFHAWAIANGYSDDLTIDRIDVNGNYEPANCRWITMSQQQFNKSNKRLLTVNGETKTIAQWAECTGLKYDTIWRRIKRGKTGADVIAETL